MYICKITSRLKIPLIIVGLVLFFAASAKSESLADAQEDACGAEIVPGLNEAFRAGQYDVVRDSLDVLEESGQLTEEIILPLLTVQSGCLDTATARYAVRVGGERSAARLAELLPDLSGHDRYDVVGILAEMGPKAAVAAPALAREAARMNTGSRASVVAVEALGNIGPDARDTIPVLLELYEKRIHPRRILRENILKIAPDMATCFEPVATQRMPEYVPEHTIRPVDYSGRLNVASSRSEHWQWERVGPKSIGRAESFQGVLSVARAGTASFFVGGTLYRLQEGKWTADEQYEKNLLGTCRGGTAEGADLHLLYASYNTRNDGVYYTCYHEGARMEKIQLLPLPSGTSDSYDLAVGSDGSAHACYVDRTTETLMYGHRSANGKWGWDAVGVAGFKTEGFHRYYPAIAVADEGTVYIVFKQYDLLDVDGRLQPDIRLRLATRAKGKWSIETLLPNLGYIDGKMQLEVDADGILHLAFEHACMGAYAGSWPDMRLVYGTREHSEWSFESVHIFDAGQGGFQLALDEDGGPNILISDLSDPEGEGGLPSRTGPLWLAIRKSGSWMFEQVRANGIYRLSSFVVSFDGTHHAVVTELTEQGDYVLIYGRDKKEL